MFKLNKGQTLHIGNGKSITATDGDCYVIRVPRGAWIETPYVPHEPAVTKIAIFPKITRTSQE